MRNELQIHKVTSKDMILVELFNLTFENGLLRNRDLNVKFAPPGRPRPRMRDR